MKVLASITLFALACSAFAAGQPPAWARYHFKEVASLHDLPAPILDTLGAHKPGLEGIADRGQPFNATDVIEHPWPFRRFVIAGHDGNAWLVAYEQGGYAHAWRVLLFVGDTVTERWVLYRPVTSLKEVLDALPHAQEVTE